MSNIITNVKKDIPVMKLFIKEGNFYVYDTYNNLILRVNAGQYQELTKLYKYGIHWYKNLKTNMQSYKDIIMLLERGFFREPWIEKIEHPLTYLVEDIVTRKLNYMTLQVTQDCNFKCRYCLFTKNNGIERVHSTKNMSYVTAKDSIDYLWDHSKDSDTILIGFYGGEPLLNYSLIKKVVEYANSRFETKRVKYNMTTNGSIINDEIIKFLTNNDFSLTISLDGPSDIQNLHRKMYYSGDNSFDLVWKNVNRIRSQSPKWFDQKVIFHPVLLPGENVSPIYDFFDENSIHQNKVQVVYANMAGIDYDSDFGQNQRLKIEDKELMKRVMTQNNRTNLQEKYNDKKVISSVWHHNGPCVPGLKKIFIDVDGYIYPCEKVNSSCNNSIGSIYMGINEKKVQDFMNLGKMTEESCKECFAMRFCTQCMFDCYNPETEENDITQKKIRCKQVIKSTIKFLKETV